MRLSERRKCEIRHLQEKLAERNKTIGQLHDQIAKERKEHSDFLAKMKAGQDEMRSELVKLQASVQRQAPAEVTP